MLKTLEEFRSQFPNVDDDDWEGVVIKDKAFIAVKRPSLTATKAFMAKHSTDTVGASLEFVCSALLTPTVDEFKKLAEDYPAVLGDLATMMGELSSRGVERVKKA